MNCRGCGVLDRARAGGVLIILKVVNTVEMVKKAEMQPACRDYTLNMHKRLQGIQFKKRAPMAIKKIRKFAQTEMFTKVSYRRRLTHFVMS